MYVYTLFAVIQLVNFFDNACDVPMLNGDNYKIWKENVLLQLECMEIDYAIRKDEPIAPTKTSTQAKVALYEQWERSNRLSMMFLRRRISVSIRGSILECNNAKQLLKAIDEQFESSDKAYVSTLMIKLSSIKITSVRGVRKHLM
ncbi:uncharacterized protein LOC123193133 [Mangifera indica]|uniref:uncharacterized protein LOC123193133 n=1 Tax=Mangifera indica TaxID=29780 RepID=UPI001CF9A59E|nr:uncharacterized protein LOC123193133 [Mangifera indica]